MQTTTALDRAPAIRFAILAFAAVLLAAIPAGGEPAAASPALQQEAAADGTTGDAEAAGTEPCPAPEHRQFDFWIGSWEVRDPSGAVVGHNRIEPILSGCALEENWASARGSKGRSLNMYDRAGDRWHQTWMDEHGQLLELDGGLEGGKMVLGGEVASLQRSGTTALHRITWEPLEDGRVRQHWQASRDGGESWTTLFEGFYSREE
jgi:hypothetical protein